MFTEAMILSTNFREKQHANVSMKSKNNKDYFLQSLFSTLPLHDL